MGVFKGADPTMSCVGEGVDRGLLEDSGGQPPLQHVVNLHHSPEGVVLVELFAGLSTRLAVVLEVGLSAHVCIRGQQRYGEQGSQAPHQAVASLVLEATTS